MIRGVGVDMLAVARMERLLKHDHFLARVFTEGERARIRGRGLLAAQTAAGIFCAKEAYAKATGRGLSGSLFHEVEVTWAPDGRPALRSSAPSDRGILFHLSITHDGGFAAAFVVCEEASP